MGWTRDAETVRQILQFWFGADSLTEPLERRKVWFQPPAEFDAEIRTRFLDVHERAAAGEFDGWTTDAEGCLALAILLDQFPRNLFRGTARAFATDDKARGVAVHALEKEFDTALPPVARLFLYLPFEHSESLTDQNRSVSLFAELGDKEWLDYAVRHREIVAQFDRFPHRNEALGRPSTPQETAFLTQPGSSF